MILAAGDYLRQLPKADTPVLSIAITFSVFTVIILAAYFMFVRYERKQEKKRAKTAGLDIIQEKNAYDEKFNFLYTQEVSASTL
jgi:uncharacterized protein YpmB